MPYEVCCESKLHMKLPPSVARIPLTGLQRLLPTKLLSTYGLVSEHKIDAIFDASGFAYSDQWGGRALELMGKRSRKWKKSDKKVILLPQALGPFRGKKSAELFKRMVEYCDVIYARDNVSYGYCREVIDDLERIQLAPDITIPMGIQTSGSRLSSPSPDIWIVPNARMVDKQAVASQQDYVAAMAGIITECHRLGHSCGFLVHEGNDDLVLAQEVVEGGGISFSDVPIVRFHDPLEAKAALGNCRLVVGARFHALVSALSQGIPSFALGWSHKYQELLSSFGFSEGILSVEGLLKGDDLARISEYMEASRYTVLRNRIRDASQRLAAQSEAMWDEIAAKLTKEAV